MTTPRRIAFMSIIAAALPMLAQMPRSAAPIAPQAQEQMLTDATKKIINQSVITTGNKDFPKVAALSTSGGPTLSCCTPGQTRSRDVLPFSQYTGKNENKNKQYGPYTHVEGSDSCWVISDYKRVDKTAAGKYQIAVSHQPANFHLILASSYTNEYQNIRNYLLTFNLPKNVQGQIEAKLSEFVKNYSAYSMQIDTSHAIVQQTVILWGAGMFNGRSWYEGYVNITESCCPPEVRDVNALDTVLRTWVNDVVKKYRNQPVLLNDYKPVS